MRNKTALLGSALALAAVVSVHAHVTVAPAESKHNTSERFTVRVPTEGQVATTGVNLAVPPGVTVTSILASNGWKSDIRREGTRVVAVSWTVDIPVGHFGELGFMARNPSDGAEIVWKFTQKFADGTLREWTPATKLNPAQP